MKTPEQIQAELDQYTGTERYYHYSSMFPSILLTEGTKRMAEVCGAYWLIDVIASHVRSVKDSFSVALLTVNNGKAKFTLTDDLPANITYAKQSISFTDFPLPEMKMYVGFDGVDHVLMLPTEWWIYHVKRMWFDGIFGMKIA
jgi:hypothetical protein